MTRFAGGDEGGPLIEQIRTVLREHGQLSVDIDTIGPDDDLYRAGMSSHAGVNVMLALEELFDVEFPDQMLTRSAFSTMNRIESCLTQLVETV